MAISYALFENNLTTDPTDYSAVVQTTTSADLDAIIRRVIQQGSTSTEGDIVAVFEDVMKACEALLLEGARVNLGGLCELYPRLPGTFDGATDSFDRSRHRVDVGASAGSRIRTTVRNQATVQKTEAILPSPSPIEYQDLGSGEKDGTLTPGNIGTLTGNRLKYDVDQADEGIYLVPTAGGGDTKVEAVQRNKPGQLIFLVPAGLSGDYRIEVRARVYGGSALRTGRLDAVLTA